MSRPVSSNRDDRSISTEADRSRVLVYKSVFSLVQEISAASDFEVYKNLDAQYETMSADDSISAIVKSLDSRKALLQVFQRPSRWDRI
ncbi:hypothetical protein B0H12DRAFT_1159772 [Mycena haematopus]|nr:hypothetical protein B0H12DRAFT_1159772 [Mycena haematopus]